MNPESLKNLRRGAPPKARICNCCGEAKATSAFSWNQGIHEYVKTCRECGQWLFLFRKVFGDTRDWEKNRADQRKRDFEKRITERPINIAGVALWNAWHQPSKDNHA
jgi:hypothetical protein